MKIKGEFGRFDAPYVEARLICKGLGIEESVKFLVDTGASCTIINDTDAVRLRIDYDKLQRLEKGIAGIGGEVDTYSMKDVKLIFEAQEGIHIQEMDQLLVTKHERKDKHFSERIKWIPSLLGRDFLNRFGLAVSKSKAVVSITDEEIVDG